MKNIVKLPKQFLNCKFNGNSLSSFKKNQPVINFSPGPAQFPREILDKIYLDSKYYPAGATFFEISHRSTEFNILFDRVNQNIKDLMKIPDDFTILWTQGGGHGQFSSIPLNFLPLINSSQNKANYIVTGTWSSRAYEESQKFINSYNSYYNHFNTPLKINFIEPNDIKISNNDKYVYFCSNETVNGLEFKKDGINYPSRKQLKNAYSIIDMSSDFTLKSLPWQDIDVAFSCSSKNLGMAGATVTSVRNNIFEEINNNEQSKIPSILDWVNYKKSKSLYNTPAIYNLYVIDKFLDYYLKKGGIVCLEEESKIKAKKIYEFLDNSNMYLPCVDNSLSRSNINIPFTLINHCNDTVSKFLHFCFINNIVGLKTKTPFNYKLFNLQEPLRINLYNGISIEDTEYLIDVMKKYENNI